MLPEIYFDLKTAIDSRWKEGSSFFVVIKSTSRTMAHLIQAETSSSAPVRPMPDRYQLRWYFLLQKVFAQFIEEDSLLRNIGISTSLYVQGHIVTF